MITIVSLAQFCEVLLYQGEKNGDATRMSYMFWIKPL